MSSSKVDAATNTQRKICDVTHTPVFSVLHPCIPRLYVMPWKQNMKNRRLILLHQKLHNIPDDEGEESLFWEKRERLCHGEDRRCLEDQMNQLTPGYILNFPMSSHLSRYGGTMIRRWGRSRV
ncbi:sperm-associated microtubule inner protein 10-like [Rhinoraja longicauda]